MAKHLAFLALKTEFEVTFVRFDKMFKHLFASLVDGTHERTLKVLDRFAHSSYQILMEGESIRKQKRPK